MDWLSKIFSSSAGGFVESVANTVGKFVTTDKEREQLRIELEALLQKRDAELEETFRTEMEAKERVLVAELNQDDNYTKRARPTLVYFGLFVIFFNYCFIPLIQLMKGVENIQPFMLPEEFWWAWGGVVSTWTIGKSFERTGYRNRVVDRITGTKDAPSLFRKEAKG